MSSEGRHATGRPRLHFTPARGWVNDPYGLTWHDGRYHVFFQHVPGSTAWAAEQHWGHAVSHDLVHWTERPVVLTPGDGDGGLWSGTVVETPSGEGRAFYTAVDLASPRVGVVRLARAVDGSWDGWEKGPVVVTPPAGLDLAELRDPCVVRDGGRWRMVLGGGTTRGEALLLTWTSADLEDWTYDGVLVSAAKVKGPWTGDAWECPQLFELDEAWVLVVSVWTPDATHHEICAVGDLQDGRFVARRWQRLTHGPVLYAGSAFTDAEGRRCLVHWLRGVEDPDSGWAGAHSVPHVIRLDGDRVVLDPHPAVVEESEVLSRGRHVVGGATLALGDSELAVTCRDGSTFSMPCSEDGPVRLLVDGPVVEVFGPRGVAAFTIPP